MARYTDAVCKLCRREGMKLFLKGDRCYTEKCAIERRAYPPGQHGQSRSKFSEYGNQLREKQKVKRIYGLMERQFRLTFKEAERQKGVTGELLLSRLESRLDTVVYKIGFASSRADARQLILHRHVLVNGRMVRIPSFILKEGDVIEVREKSKKMDRIVKSIEAIDRRGLPTWIELDRPEMKATLKTKPDRTELTMPITEQLIVELYSK